MVRSASRVRSTSRRRFGDFELDVATGALRCRGRRVPVEPKAFDVLVYLFEHRERVVSVDELLSRVWRGVAVERGSVHRAVRVLRRALETEGGPPAIETVARRGYRFAPGPRGVAGAARAAGGPRYVGRSALLGELERRVEGARAGRPELVLLHGPAGIGKTTTLAWIAHRAAAGGARVLEGRCLEAPGAAPYRPWSRVLRAAIHADGPAAIVRELGPGVADVVRAMPELGAALGAGGSGTSDRGSREGIHDALAEWIRLRCERAPLLLAFDDLHRADLDSIEVMASIVREVGAARLLVVATYRDATGASATHRSIASLAALQPGAALQLRELSRAEVRELAALRTGKAPAESEIERLAAASGGNPLFLEHLLRAGGESGDAAQRAGLRGALLRLLEDASPSCADFLAQASVCGRELDVAAIAASLGRPPASVQADVAQAFALRLLEPDADGDARFVHGLIPELLYAGLPELERVERHRRALDGILATRLDPRDRSAEIAHHASEAASVIGAARAFDHLVAAAREARDRFAWEEAAAFFERALALRDGGAADRKAARAACLVELATLLVLRGDAEAARPRFARACELARDLDDAQLFARAALGPSQVEEYQELDPAQVAALGEAIEQLGDRDPGLRVELLIAFARTGYYADSDLMLGATEEALALARRVGAPELVCRAALARAVALGWTQRHAERRALVTEANRIARRSAPTALVTGVALLHAARECLADGDRVGFEREVRRLETLADAHRLAFFDWSLAAIRGTRALLEGRFADASAGVDRLLERGRRANPVLAFQIAAVHRTMIALAVEAPGPVVALLRPLAIRFPEVSPWGASLAMTLAASGRAADAAVEAEKLLGGDLRPRHRDFLPVVLAMLAQTAQRLGDARLAAIVAGELPRIGDRCIVLAECLAFQGAVDRYRGLCAEAAGDVAAAVDLYERGLHTDEAMGALPCVARGRFDLGRALRLRGGAGDAAAAARSFAAATDLAARLGMRPLIEEIHAASGGA